MRIARKFVLLAIMVAAALAVAAPSASAQVEISEETPTGLQHCGPVVATEGGASGDCELNAEGPDVFLELFGEPLTICHNSFEAYIDEDGHGYLTHQVLTGTGCIATPCESAPGVVPPWEVQAREEVTPLGNEWLSANFCVVVGGVPIDCTIHDVLIEQHSHTHAEFSANQAICEEDETLHVTGQWEATTAAPGIEIVH